MPTHCGRPRSRVQTLVEAMRRFCEARQKFEAPQRSTSQRGEGVVGGVVTDLKASPSVLSAGVELLKGTSAPVCVCVVV